MRRIAERLLRERGDEPLSLLSQQLIDRESGIGKEDKLRSWMRRAASNDPSRSDERPLMPIRLTSERISMPFRILINSPEGIQIDGTTPASHILAMLQMIKGHPAGLNDLSDANDAANAVLELWKEEKGAGWSINPNGIARPVEEQWNPKWISVGRFHRTALWPVVCRITSEALGSGLFSMEMDQCVEFEQQVILDGEWDQAEPYQLSRIKNECWNKPWWGKTISQLWQTKKPLEMKKLQKKVGQELLEDGALIIEAIAAYDKECKESWVEATEKKMLDLLEETSFVHESIASQIFWGVNDEYLVESLDGYLESRISEYAVFNWTEVTKINNGVAETYTNEHLYRKRVLLRSQIEAWFNAAERTLTAP